ncbi:MAG: DMT family transporter [Candidatus Dormibacteraeota bacterium]|jgi:drug/metabolite transporter (DMT)-like permease|nr:DMT family transporter [Candidatus Dormibacteraeota bacterium]
MELHDMWQISLNPRRITAQRLTTSQMAAAALVLVVALWGVSFVVVRSAIAAYPVVGFLVLRFVIGGGALMAVAYLHRGSRPDWGSVRKGSLLAVGVALAVGYVTQTLGLQLGASPGVAATLTSLVVVLTPAWEWAMSGRTPDRRVAVSSLLAIAGTLMICETAAPAAVSAHGIPALGVVLEVVSAAAFALQVVLVGRLGETLSATALGGAQLLLVALILLPALPFTGGLPMPSAGVMAAITFSALGASAFGFAVQAAAQKHISTAAAAVIMATEPGFALIAGVLVGEQNIGVIAGLGFALLLLGVVAQTDGRWGNRVRWLLLAMVRGNRLRRQEA